MPFQTALLASDAYASLRSNMPGWKAQSQNAASFMQANSVDSAFIFTALDQLHSIIVSINNMVAVAGLNTYATGQGYTGTLTTDANAVVTAAQNCIAWVVTNFPASGGFLQSHTLNADGTRTPRSFTPAQTVGLQNSLTSLVATIQ